RGYVRIPGVAALAAAVAYVFTTGSAYAINVVDRHGAQRIGMITLFAYNFRYAMPALALGLALLTAVRFRGRPRTHVPLLAFFVGCAALAQTGLSSARTWWPGRGNVSILTAAVVVVVACLVWLSSTGNTARRMRIAIAGVLTT